MDIVTEVYLGNETRVFRWPLVVAPGLFTKHAAKIASPSPVSVDGEIETLKKGKEIRT